MVEAPELSSASSYGALDRALHRLAFATPRAQVAIADLEDRLFRRELARVTTGSPVLVTGLPRSGTTILLELFAGSLDLSD